MAMRHRLKRRVNDVNVYKVTSDEQIAIVLADDVDHAQSLLNQPDSVVEYIGLTALPAGILLAIDRKHYGN